MDRALHLLACSYKRTILAHGVLFSIYSVFLEKTYTSTRGPSERNGVLSTVVLTWLPGTCTGTSVVEYKHVMVGVSARTTKPHIRVAVHAHHPFYNCHRHFISLQITTLLPAFR